MGLLQEGRDRRPAGDIRQEVYDNPRGYTGWPLIIATIFFAFQIYCDFSGYSDIAIGSARVLGFKLRDNFCRPYLARDIADFWSRWHISLSTWFRDYVYIPLGGNRRGPPRLYVNLFVTFLLSGLWHGANWTFVVWGAVNGAYLVAGRLTARARQSVYRSVGISTNGGFFSVIRTLTTFALICVSWVFFRAHTVGDAIYILSRMFRPGRADPALAGFGRVNFALSLALIAFVAGVESFQELVGEIRQRVAALPAELQWVVSYAMCLVILAFGVFSGRQAFIYFQF